MKPKECAKYVFCRLGGIKTSFRLKNDGRMLAELFPDLDFMFDEAYVQKVEFLFNGKNPALAWYDKHGNIIVRVHHTDTQCKINF